MVAGPSNKAATAVQEAARLFNGSLMQPYEYQQGDK